VAFAVTACLLVACSSQENPDRAAPSAAAGSPTSVGPDPGPKGTTTAPEDVRARLPAVPSTSEPAVLAGQLDRAAATLRDPDARAVDVRRAGEFQQLAVRALATASDAFRRRVMRRLDPETALVTRPAVRASRQLHGLTSPQQKLPRWRIVAPPPAAELRGHYRAAQRRTGVPWTYLAAIHLVETRMGRIRGTSTAGARGPMQFIPPTWEAYGAGGDINDPRDAILAAARLLRAHGAPRDMADALWHYNPADEYVRAVSAHARTMQRSPSTYRGYWHWRVLYRHERGTYVLPVGYPKTRAVLLPEE
jgi:membrane-bound lytic murein transglycosylase B